MGYGFSSCVKHQQPVVKTFLLAQLQKEHNYAKANKFNVEVYVSTSVSWIIFIYEMHKV